MHSLRVQERRNVKFPNRRDDFGIGPHRFLPSRRLNGKIVRDFGRVDPWNKSHFARLSRLVMARRSDRDRVQDMQRLILTPVVPMSTN